MKHLIALCAVAIPLPLLASTFERPIPQAQSATAEYWFALASLALIAALIVVAKLIARE